MLSSPQKQSGFTLIEILVALALGLLIIGGAFSYFLSTLQTSKDLLSQSKLQQEIKSTANFIQRDLRRAGYKPAGSSADVGIIYLGKSSNTLTSNNCVLYSYVDERGSLRAGGFVLHANKLYMYTNKANISSSCPANASSNTDWTAITLGAAHKITDFIPTIEDDGNRPLLRVIYRAQLSSVSSARFELDEQIVLHNFPAKKSATVGS